MNMIEIEELIEKNEEDLLELLGEELLKDELKILPISKKKILKTGKNWWVNNKKNIQKIICKESIYDLIASDKSQLVIAIADLISGAITGVSPFVVATLIVNYGIKNFCDKE